MRRIFALVIALAVLGCARFPAGGSSNFTKRLVFTLTVDSKLRTGLEQGGNGLPYVYIVAIRLSTDPNPPDQGPIPVVVPGGNGFVAGHCTHFVLWNPLASPAYQIYQFSDDTLNDWFLKGYPIQSLPISEGDKTLSFEIDLSQLVPAADVPTIQSVQVNFLTMNNTNTSGGGRLWDALGDGNVPSEINSYFTFQPNSAITYTNASTGNVEPQGDVADPDLDIVDWSIEVRLP